MKKKKKKLASMRTSEDGNNSEELMSEVQHLMKEMNRILKNTTKYAEFNQGQFGNEIKQLKAQNYEIKFSIKKARNLLN